MQHVSDHLEAKKNVEKGPPSVWKIPDFLDFFLTLHQVSVHSHPSSGHRHGLLT